MENEFQRLSREARSYAEILRQKDGHIDGDAESGSAPHVETIDFDRLCDVLDSVCDQLDAAQQLYHDAATIRQWLVGRIQSLQRGRRAIINERGIADESSPPDTSSAGELIRRFEEISASLRASPESGRMQSRRPRSKYHEFKS
jgi:hypothetical protein